MAAPLAQAPTDAAREFSLRPADARDEQALEEMFQRCFGTPRSAAQWRWRWFGAAGGHGEAHVLVAGDTPVGHWAGLVSDMWLNGERRRMLLGGEIMVLPDFRRRGGMGMLIRRGRRLADERADVWVGFATDEAARLTEANGGGKLAGRLPAWIVWPRRVPHLPPPADRLVARLLAGGRALTFRLLPCAAVAPLEDVADSELDALATVASSYAPCMRIRDSRYVHWRWLDRPEGTVVGYATRGRSGQLTGYIVVGVEGDESARIGRVLDVLAADPASLRGLLRRALSTLTAEGCEVITFDYLDPRHGRATFSGLRASSVDRGRPSRRGRPRRSGMESRSRSRPGTSRGEIPMSPERKLRVAYAYRHFSSSGSIPSLYRRLAEQLAHDLDVTLYCAVSDREPTDAPLRFRDVEPIAEGDGRIRYALECVSFARRATRAVSADRDAVDVVHCEGFALLKADLVTVHAVRAAEIGRYFQRIEPKAKARRFLSPYVLNPQAAIVLAIERRLFADPAPLCLAASQQIKVDLENEHGVPSELIDVIPYAIDVDRFRFDSAERNARRAELGVSEDETVALFVGDSFLRKGLGTVLEAVARSTSRPLLWVSAATTRRRTWQPLRGSAFEIACASSAAARRPSFPDGIRRAICSCSRAATTRGDCRRWRQ